MDLVRNKALMKSFIESQLAYFVWMCCNQASINCINYLLEHTLLHGKQSTFEQFPEKDSSARICLRNLRILATELHGAKEILAAFNNV